MTRRIPERLRRFFSGDLQRDRPPEHYGPGNEPPGVEYAVRDEQGRVVEIVTKAGERIYVEHE
jgi:hypothetical protein